MNTVWEVNFDGLVGPTHNYAGLSRGNLASVQHGGSASNPREAALQGLAKMKVLADLGLKQALLPPHERPHLRVLRHLGFSGTDAAVLAAAAEAAPELLAACASSSAMWTANAATVAPSVDTADGCVHLTPANLVSKFHRAIENPATGRILEAIFGNPYKFAVHLPLEGGLAMADEGAANHTRLGPSHAHMGLHVFVYGASAFQNRLPRPTRFAARQTLEASQTVARTHRLDPEHVLYLQQHPAAIDAGVFHNDVISVGNNGVFLYHESAFVETEEAIARLRQRYRKLFGEELLTIGVPEAEISLSDAVASYLFNSQILTLPNGGMVLVVPGECQQVPRVHAWLENLVADERTPIRQIYYFDLRQSMRNGGGPACLRLRVPLTDAECEAVSPGVWLNNETYPKLVAWVKRHYRDRLAPADLADPLLLDESRRALDELTRLLGLPSIYRFQLG